MVVRPCTVDDRTIRSRVGGSIQLKQGGGGRVQRNVAEGGIQLFSNDGRSEVRRNRIDGNLQCKGNDPRPVGGGNVVQGTRRTRAACELLRRRTRSSDVGGSAAVTACRSADADGERLDPVDEPRAGPGDTTRMRRSSHRRIWAVTDGADLGTIHEQLAAAVRDREERDRLARRLDEARARVREAEALVAERAAALESEERNVERLESFSPARIWAGLTGRRDADLDRETAERDAARYALADAQARLATATWDADAFTEQLRALGDVEGRYQAALAAKDAWVRDHDPVTGEQLTVLAEELGRLEAEDHELAEAHAAGSRARDRLLHADDLLGRAGGWSDWDTFGGGGMVTDMMKYSRIDEATAQLRLADEALRSFSRELADVRMAAVQGVEVGEMTRFFDVWFDNIFSDWAVRDRIRDAAERTGRARAAVDEALRQVSARGRDIQVRVAGITAERERLLLDGA